MSILDWFFEVQNAESLDGLDGLLDCMSPLVLQSGREGASVDTRENILVSIKALFDRQQILGRAACVPELYGDFQIGECTFAMDLELHFGDFEVDDDATAKVAGDVAVAYFSILAEVTQSKAQIVAWNFLGETSEDR